MKALVLDAAHQPLQFRDVADPTPGPGEVVVALRAAALNHRDLWIQKGQYAGLKFPIIPGSDGCGEVVECGEGVDAARWQGQEVIINPGLDWGERPPVQADRFRILGLPDDGTFAERVRVPVGQLMLKPPHLDAPHAAALPLAGLTAYRALFTRAGLQPGERVLISGVGGGVALFALQFALAARAAVYFTTGSEEKMRRAVQLGALGGADYHHAGWARRFRQQMGGFDVIIDGAGGPGFEEIVEAAAPGARIALYGATRGNPPGFDLRKVFWKQLSILGTTMGSPTDFGLMCRFVVDKQIVPLADHVFPLAEGNAALAAMESAEQFGKIVLTM